jgi:hypothetical protein
MTALKQVRSPVETRSKDRAPVQCSVRTPNLRVRNRYLDLLGLVFTQWDEISAGYVLTELPALQVVGTGYLGTDESGV